MKVPSLSAPYDIVVAYLKTIRAGEKVVEHGKNCMEGCEGTTYKSKETGDICVNWTTEVGAMGTSLTLGTRRLKDKIPVD